VVVGVVVPAERGKETGMDPPLAVLLPPLKIKEQTPAGGFCLSACRPLLMHEPETTRRISRLSKRLMKRGKGVRSGE
jgi:hypothetical protein